jgi:O-antigen ligase/predicted negative regulator of RcsB-dependent stress response
VAKKQNILKLRTNSNSVWVLITGVAAVTLYFNSQLNDPFNTPKLILLLVLAGWILSHLINSYRNEPLIPKSSEFKIVMLSMFFTITLLISTLLTDVKLIGFIGDTQRRNGFLGYLGLVVIFLYASRALNFYYSLRLIKCAILLGFALSFYGVIQILGRDFVDWDNQYNDMIATLGNPNFASAMLAVLSIIAFGGLFIRTMPVGYKLLTFIFLIMALFAIIKSQSRQGLVTLLFALLFSSTIYIYLNYKKLILLFLPITFSLSLLAILGMLQKGPFAAFLYKDSVSVRGFYWRAGIEMFKDKPLTGIGVDRYGAYFKEFREVAYPLRYGYEITSSNAHNTIIQLFSTAGIFVGLTYLAILGFVLFSGLKLVKNTKNDEQKIALVLLTGWVGFEAQSLISIDNIGISVWGWLLGGAVLGLAFNGNQLETKELSKNVKSNQVTINLFQPLLALLLLLPIVTVSSYLYRSEKDTYMVQAFASSNTQEGKSALIQYFNDLTKNPLSDPYYKFKSALFLYEAGFSEQSSSELNKLIDSDPRNIYYLNAIGYLASQRQDLELAVKSLSKIADVDPWNAENYNQLGVLYLQKGNKEQAKRMFQKIIDFAPNTEQAQLAKTNLEKL